MIGRTPKDVTEWLTCVDGMCRDINWFGINTNGAAKLLRWIGERYSITALQEDTAEDPQPCDIEAGCAALSAGRNVHGYFENGPPEMSQIQYYSWPEGGDEWFVELTFFPQDVALGNGLRRFLELLEGARRQSGATGYFVRCENASFEPTWEKRSAAQIIYSSDDVPSLLDD